MGILLSGSGLLGILLGLRGAQEAFGNLTLGIVMSAFYIGYMAGAWICPPLILRVGHIRAFASFAACAAALSLAYGLAVDPVVWWCLRILNGIMIMGIYMVIESWLNERVQTGRAADLRALHDDQPDRDRLRPVPDRRAGQRRPRFVRAGAHPVLPLMCGAVMHLLEARGFPVALGLVTITLASFCVLRIRRDPPRAPATKAPVARKAGPGGACRSGLIAAM